MSYQEKKYGAMFVTQMLLLAAYVIIALGRYRAGLLNATDLKAWAAFMLIAAAISFVVILLAQVVFHFGLASKALARHHGVNEKTREDLEDIAVKDEMDEAIELKSGWVNASVMSVGGLVALLSLLLGASYALMLNIFFLSGFLGMIAENAVTFNLYRRGLNHG